MFINAALPVFALELFINAAWSAAVFFFARGDGAAAAACFAARLRCTAPKERSRGLAARGLRCLVITGTVLARTVLGRATLAKKVETTMGG